MPEAAERCDRGQRLSECAGICCLSLASGSEPVPGGENGSKRAVRLPPQDSE